MCHKLEEQVLRLRNGRGMAARAAELQASLASETSSRYAAEAAAGARRRRWRSTAEAKAAAAMARQREEHLEGEREAMRERADRADATREHDERRRQEADERAGRSSGSPTARPSCTVKSCCAPLPPRTKGSRTSRATSTS